MSIKEFYESFDPSGNEYANVMGRLGTERLVSKYLNKMIDDKSFGNLKKQLLPEIIRRHLWLRIQSRESV